MRQPTPVAERLKQHSEEVPETGCRIWKGRVDRHGYPEIKIGDTRMNVRPIAFFIAMGEDPQSNLVGRPQISMTCGRRDCINPDHMRVKTDEDRLLTQIKQEIYQWGRIKALADPKCRFMTTPRYVEAKAREELERRLEAKKPPTAEVRRLLDLIHRRLGGDRPGEHDGGDERPGVEQAA